MLAGGTKMYKQMLVPLDGSNLAEVVFTYAKELAGHLGVNLVFLNVCSPEEAGLLPMRRTYVERMAEIVKNQSLEVQKQIDIGTTLLIPEKSSLRQPRRPTRSV
jgi:nucleotide-binding universal stress UspA family protein